MTKHESLFAALACLLVPISANAQSVTDSIPPIQPAEFTVGVRTVATGLVAPNFGVAAHGLPRHLFVVDQPGQLWRLGGHKSDHGPIVFLDLSSLLVNLGIASLGGYDERGFLGLAFSPTYSSDGLFYTFTTEPAGFRQTMNFFRSLMVEGDILGEDIDVSLGRSEEAVPILEHAFNIADDFVHKDPNDQTSRQLLAGAATDMAGILRHSDAGRALAVYDHALRHMAEISNTHIQYVILLAGSSYALRRLGRPAEARQRLDAAFARLTQLKLATR